MGSLWLAELQGAVEQVLEQWSLQVERESEHPTGTASLVLFVRRSEGTPAVLKMSMPHMEAQHEAHGLRFWDGDPTVRLLAADDSLNALLLERCRPGSPLTELPEPEQDIVLADRLLELWRSPPEAGPFRPLTVMLEQWSREASSIRRPWDPGLTLEGTRIYEELPGTAPRKVLLATDLHAGNVLRSERQDWLVIDPKPFVGDPAYDLVQHLLNCESRMRADPRGTIRRMAELTEQDETRVRLWVFARLVTGTWSEDQVGWLEVARQLAP